jgi:hypothetical protein
MKLSTENSKILAFQGKYLTRSKLCMYNKITEQFKCFKYTGYYVAYQNKRSTAEKITNFNPAMGVINHVFESNLIQNTQE